MNVESGARGVAGQQLETKTKGKSTQNTQYDQIGEEYLKIKLTPATEPEVPSIIAALGEGDVRGKKCLDLACGTGKYTSLLHTLGARSVTGHDISSAMITAATSTYPPSSYPTLHFSVLDCSLPSAFPPTSNSSYDLIFSAWFLNYAGTASELTNMFRVIEQQMAPGGRFVGMTTDVHSPNKRESRLDFYGIDIVVLDPEYRDPDSGEVVGVKAKVVLGGGSDGGEGFSFEVFMFGREVYERCAGLAGLRVEWKEAVVPQDERRETGYWDRWLGRPTFCMLEARRVGE